MRIIDMHDDLGQAYLADLCGEEPSDFFKSAGWRESSELLDRDFALILVDDEGHEHRKFASFDAGNTWMSAYYLLTVQHGLPDYAVKVAAANLLKSAAKQVDLGEAGLALEKLSLLDIGKTASAVIDERRVFVKQGAASEFPMAPPTTPAASSLKMPSPGAAASQPMTRLASFDIIKEAQLHWAEMNPYERRDLSLSLSKIAFAEAAQVPWEIEQYSGEVLNPRFEAIMRNRQNYASTPELAEDYARLGKVASVLNLEEAIEALYMLDEQAGILGKYGSALPDPVLAVCAVEKVAEYSWVNGGNYVNERQLILFSHNPELRKRMKALFYADMVDSFRKDPIGTFKKLPEEQKRIIVNLATQSGGSNDGGYFAGGVGAS